jgi:hypothetical protein
MRKIAGIALVALMVLSFASTVNGKSVTKTGFSFSAPFNCSSEERNGRCLVGKFKAGLNVVLVSQAGICLAKTAETFTYTQPISDYSFPVTRLIGSKECLKVRSGDPAIGPFDIGVVDTDPPVVRLVKIQDDKSPLPKDVELKARKLALSAKSAPCLKSPRYNIIPQFISDAPPHVYRTKYATFMVMQCFKDAPQENGPPVLFIHNKIFRLCGACSDSPVFFTMNGRLYLTYTTTIYGCGCGDLNFMVYDLSGPTPKRVYWDGSLGD